MLRYFSILFILFLTSNSNAEIKDKIIRANEVIKSKQLDRYRTFSIIVANQLVYCHYDRPRKDSLPLIICY